MDLKRRYEQKTPVWVELASDIFLIISTGTAGVALYQHQDTLALISIVTGIIGKILARFINVKQTNSADDSGDSSPDHVCTCTNDKCNCSSKGEEADAKGV